MKLLICTQAVDTQDPVLGFFVRWIEEFAGRVESVTVVCLRVGTHALPANVRVIGLGRGKIARAFRLMRVAYTERGAYDRVFVHMNQEYVLVAGWLWWLLGKPISMWRNHYAGSWLTDVAAAWCTHIFSTSKYSYTAKFAKTQLMPVGVDTERFCPDVRIPRIPRSILFLGRIAPSKRVDMFIDALMLLAQRGVDFTATIVGSPLPQAEAYYASLKQKVRDSELATCVMFKPAVANDEAPNVYRAHEIFVNTSPSGMLDKTIFEAAACGCLVLASSDDVGQMLGSLSKTSTVEELARSLGVLCGDAVMAEVRAQQNTLVQNNSLPALGVAVCAILEQS